MRMGKSLLAIFGFFLLPFSGVAFGQTVSFSSSSVLSFGEEGGRHNSAIMIELTLSQALTDGRFIRYEPSDLTNTENRVKFYQAPSMHNITVLSERTATSISNNGVRLNDNNTDFPTALGSTNVHPLKYVIIDKYHGEYQVAAVGTNYLDVTSQSPLPQITGDIRYWVITKDSRSRRDSLWVPPGTRRPSVYVGSVIDDNLVQRPYTFSLSLRGMPGYSTVTPHARNITVHSEDVTYIGSANYDPTETDVPRSPNKYYLFSSKLVDFPIYLSYRITDRDGIALQSGSVSLGANNEGASFDISGLPDRQDLVITLDPRPTDPEGREFIKIRDNHFTQNGRVVVIRGPDHNLPTTPVVQPETGPTSPDPNTDPNTPTTPVVQPPLPAGGDLVDTRRVLRPPFVDPSIDPTIFDVAWFVALTPKQRYYVRQSEWYKNLSLAKINRFEHEVDDLLPNEVFWHPGMLVPINGRATRHEENGIHIQWSPPRSEGQYTYLIIVGTQSFTTEGDVTELVLSHLDTKIEHEIRVYSRDELDTLSEPLVIHYVTSFQFLKFTVSRSRGVPRLYCSGSK